MALDHQHSKTNDQPTPRISCLIWVALGAVILTIVIYILIAPALDAARRASMRGQSNDNQLEIARALRMYANENDGYYPPHASGWKELLIRETGIDEGLFVSVFMQQNGGSYWYVPGRQFSRLQQDKSAERQVLLYSDPAWHWGEGGFIVYDNADCRYMQTPEFIETLESLTLPDGTPFAPHLDD